MRYLLTKLALGSKDLRIRYLLYKQAYYHNPLMWHEALKPESELLKGPALEAARSRVRQAIKAYHMQHGRSAEEAERIADHYLKGSRFYKTAKGYTHINILRQHEEPESWAAEDAVRNLVPRKTGVPIIPRPGNFEVSWADAVKPKAAAKASDLLESAIKEVKF